MQEEFNERKKEGLRSIKAKYNELCVKVKIDSNGLQDIIKKNLEKDVRV